MNISIIFFSVMIGGVSDLSKCHTLTSIYQDFKGFTPKYYRHMPIIQLQCTLGLPCTDFNGCT